MNMDKSTNDTAYRVNSYGHLAKTEEYDPTSMVHRTLTPEMRLTPEQLSMLEEAKNYPIVFEEDCPELTPEMAEAFRHAAQVRDSRKAAG